MKTKKRFFLKAAGISLAKWAGISLALVMMFAMAFAACDTGTSSSRTPTEDDDDNGTRPSTPVPDTVETTYWNANENVVLTITESGGAVSYSLVVPGTTVSSGTVTKGTYVWTFSPYAGESFTLNVSGSEPNLTFIGKAITVNGTPITIPSLYVNGYSGENNLPPPVDTGPAVTDEATLRTALAKDKDGKYTKGVFRITSVMTLKDDLVVHPGQHIIVGEIGDKGQYSVGGPLFAASGTSNTLNIEARLRLEKGDVSTSGATLSIVRGAAVNVKSGGTLYAEGDATYGAKVGVGVNVSVSTPAVFGGSGVSNLNIEGGGALHVEKTATLAVTNNPSVSKVRLEAATSALTLEKDAALAITVDTAPAVDESGAADATAEAKRIIGSTIDNVDNVIEIYGTAPGTPGAPAAIGAVGVTVDGAAATELQTAVNTAAGTATADSTAKIKDDANATGADLQALLDSNATRVTYTGNTATLTDITIPDGKTLVISGTVTAQTAAIATRGTGKLEITGTVTTAASNITKVILQSLVGASGGGTVVLKSSNNVVASGTPDLVVNLTLEIEDGATLALGNAGVTINSPGTIDNKGIISTTQANIPGADLGEFLALVGGTVEVLGTGSISVASGTLAIPKATTLKLSDTAKLTVATGANLTVEDTATLNVANTAKLTNNGTINFNAGSTLTTGAGTIENNNTINTAITDQATLKTLVAATVAEDASGKVVLNGTDATHKAEVTLESAGLTLNKQSLEIGQYATLDLGEYTITDYNKVTNGGIINTATSTPGVLTSLVGIAGAGTVVLNGADADNKAEVTLGAPLTLNTQSLEIGEHATLNLVAFALGGTKNVTNNGTVTTTATGVAALNTLLTKVKGNVTASAIEVGEEGTPDTSAALTVPDNTALTITDLAVNDADSVLTVSVGTTASTLTISNNITTNDGTIKTANAAVLATLLGKVEAGTIEVTGSFALAGARTLLANATLKVKAEQTLNVTGSLDVTSGATITAANDQTSGTITGNVTQDVTDSYTLPTTNESSIETALWGFVNNVPKNHLNGSTPYISRTAKKDLSTANNGVVTIYLTGTVADTTVSGHSVVDVWFGGKAQAATDLGGNYAIVTIGGILTPAAKLANTEVKHTNPSWAYYTGHDHNATNESEVATAQTQWPWTYINTSNYNASLTYRKYGAASNDEWILLLWEAPSSINPAVVKKATLEIKPENETLYKVIVDWTGLTIS